jgi:hypothetical protein
MEKTAQDRISVALTPEAADALGRLRERTRLSKTSLVNRAIPLYELVHEQMAAGSTLLIRAPDGTDQQVMFL